LRLCDDDRWAQEGLPEDFVLIYTEGGITSFKDNTMRDLDMRYGDLDALIKDKEAILIAQLEDTIMNHATELQETFGAVADLDCILSFAALAMDSGYVRPQIAPTEENLILISKGRHPLQEMILEKNFVPNDTLVDNDKRINMITGPNYSGKSCYARQVGLLVYMAHLGCFLPCERACISVVREILVRFSVTETCTVPQSTFQMDLSQMGTILRMAGPGSLVLVDEFGKGTSPASGIALLAAAIQALSKTGAKVVCTTHFIETFSLDMLHDGQDGIKALQMAVKVPENQSDVAIPLFKLEDGVADSSAGLVCARMAGLRPSIVDRAGEIIQLLRDGEPIRPLEEIFRAHLPFSEAQLALLRHFYQKNWSEATDEEIQDLLDAIYELSKAE
jgi:DNA mismatch repair protein MSH5